MNNFVARSLLLLLLASFSLVNVEAKSMSRRTDKISENFKQLDLPPEEIDPNVAPAETNDIAAAETPAVAAAVAETPAVTAAATNAVDESVNEIVEEAGEAASAAAATPAAAASTAAVGDAAPAATPAKPTPTKAPKPTEENPISRYCKCSESHCDCCRKFGLPLLPSGPGCARISYLGNDEMSVSLKFGQITLASRRISSKRARPICVGMPGGYSKFCGRVYGLSRAQENFKACLAFELRAEDELEAQLPVSCFKFGAEGLRVAEAEPLPTKVKKPEEDDDDDIFGFGAGGDDDDEDEEDEDYDDGEEPSAEDDDTDYGDDDDDDTEAPADADYGGFSLGGLLDELADDDDEKPAKPAKKPAAAASVTTDQTREQSTDVMQSKDEAGTVAEAAAVETTTAKAVKKAKKAKKNKKKKKASGAETETDFAYEFFNGILDFFN